LGRNYKSLKNVATIKMKITSIHVLFSRGNARASVLVVKMGVSVTPKNSEYDTHPDIQEQIRDPPVSPGQDGCRTGGSGRPNHHFSPGRLSLYSERSWFHQIPPRPERTPTISIYIHRPTTPISPVKSLCYLEDKSGMYCFYFFSWRCKTIILTTNVLFWQIIKLNGRTRPFGETYAPNI
jgi:hypothetical protein